MNVIIYKERTDPSGVWLQRVTTVTVPDTATDPETVGWNTYTRGADVPPGSYQAMRQGKRFRYEEKRSMVSTPLGSA